MPPRPRRRPSAARQSPPVDLEPPAARHADCDPDNDSDGELGAAAAGPPPNHKPVAGHEIPPLPPRPSYALVLGVEMLVPDTYDPDTYDPDAALPGTPEPEQPDPEAYAAWGRKRFGNAWHNQRETMLRERNICMEPDPLYKERQRALRILEHEVERRPFRPTFHRDRDLSNPGWKRLWARLAPAFPPDPPSTVYSDHSDTDLSGYSTFPPTPEPREPSPPPKDHWEALEQSRRVMDWKQEVYQFHRIFLKEELVDDARVRREDAPGDAQRQAELDEIEKVRFNHPIPGFESAEYHRRKRDFRLRAEGWTQERIDADPDAAKARWDEIMAPLPPQRLPSYKPPAHEGALEMSSIFGGSQGLSREDQDDLVRKFGFGGEQPSAAPPATQVESRAPTPSPPPEPEHAPKQAKRTRQTRQTPKRAKQTPQHTTQPKPYTKQLKSPKQPKSTTKQPKATTKQPKQTPKQPKPSATPRASRRLAGQAPEFAAENLLHPVAPTTAPKAARSDARIARVAKTPPPKSAKPQGVVKSKPKPKPKPKKVTRAARG